MDVTLRAAKLVRKAVLTRRVLGGFDSPALNLGE